MAENVDLTYGMGNQFLGMALTTQFPEKVGDKTFKADTRAKINEWFRQLAKCLKKVSFKTNGQWIFGAKEGWSKKTLQAGTIRPGPKGDTVQLSTEGSVEMQEAETETLWVLKDPDAKITLELTSQGRKGLYWLCYLMAHPQSSTAQSPAVLDDVVWPAVEAIGRVAALKKDIGLVDAEDDEDDPEVREEDPKPESQPKAT